jgi:hypothetical protein
MNHHKVFFLFLPGLLMLAACSPAVILPTATSIPSTVAPLTATPTVPPDWEAFTSEKFAYTIFLPAGWFIKDRPGTWAEYDPLDPKVGSGIDAFAAYLNRRVLALGIGARALPEGSTLASWMETAKTLIQNGVGQGVCYETTENEPAPAEQVILGGEPALLLEYQCPQAYDSFGLVVLAVHGGQGYWITRISPQGSAAEDRAELMQLLGTFSFAESQP